MILDFNLILANTVAGVITQLPLFILIIWAVKTIAKQMPKWIHEIFAEMQKSRVVDRALEYRK